jgi:sulfur-carrier protein
VIQVVLPRNLQILAGVGRVVEVRVDGEVTQRSVLDALEADHPALLGTMRDAVTKQRRPMIRFFACEEDLSQEPLDTPLPEAVAAGKEPLLIIGAIAGGSTTVEYERRPRRWSVNRRGCGCGSGGCASVLVVLTAGLLLSLFSAAVGIGVSVRIPLTQANVTLAGSVGKKDKAPDALPPYVHGKLGGNQNFINGSQSLTIWVAEGTVIFVVGQQEGAPLIDLHLEAR